MQSLAQVLAENPIIVLVVTGAALWPVLKGAWKATRRLVRFVTGKVGRGSNAYQLASRDQLFFLSHVVFVGGTLIFFEILITAIGLTFPRVNSTPIADSNFFDLVPGLIVILFRGLQGLLLSDVLAMSYVVRGNREKYPIRDHDDD